MSTPCPSGGLHDWATPEHFLEANQQYRGCLACGRLEYFARYRQVITQGEPFLPGSDIPGLRELIDSLIPEVVIL